MTRGGARPNSGPKPRYAGMETQRIVRVIPVKWVSLVDAYINQLNDGIVNVKESE